MTLLRNRQFLWFTLGQSVSLFGDKLHFMALTALVGSLEPRSTGGFVAVLAVLYCAPFVLILPVAGMIVDRTNRKWTLVACDLARAVLVAFIPFSAASGRLTLVLALVATVFVLTLVFNVAQVAIVPDLVAADHLLEANAVSNLTGRVATLGGIVLGGILVGWPVWQRLGLSGYAAGFYVDSLTFWVSVATLLALTGRPSPAAAPRSASLEVLPGQLQSSFISRAWGRVWRDLREVARLARRDVRVAWVLVSAALLGILAGATYIVIVVVLQTRTAWGTPGVGYVIGIMAGGIVAGSILVERFGRRWSGENMIVAGFVALAGLLFASARPFAFAYHGPLSFAAGLALAPITIAQDTVLHQTLPEDVRGRVFSIRDVCVNVCCGIAAAAAGLAISALTRAGVADPFRPVLLTLVPIILIAVVGAHLLLRGEAAVLLPAAWLLRWLPARAAGVLAVAIADFCWVVQRQRRRTLDENFEYLAAAASRAERRSLAKETFRNLARCSVDFLRVPAMRREDLFSLIEWRGREHLEHALSRGKGVLLLSGHVGNWELAGCSLAAYGYPLHVVAEGDSRRPGAFSAYERFRTATGMEVTPLGRSGRVARSVLEGGKILALVCDRVIAGRGHTVAFGGGRRALPLGPAKLARRFDATVLIMYVVLNPAGPQRYLGVIEPFTFAVQALDDRTLTQSIGERLSRIAERYPDQWFVFQPGWAVEA